jgi:Family of unknown function (DUF5719)
VADRSTIRLRLVAVAIAVAAVAASGVFLDRAVGARSLGGGSVRTPPSGAWYCPHGGSPGWEGWVVVTNPGATPVRVRLTQLATTGIRSVTTFTAGPRSQTYRSVSAGDASDVTTVEYFGGWVGAGVVMRSGSPAGLASEHCEATTRRTSYLLDQPTGADDASYVVVMNPFSADAAFDVVIRTELRRIPPGALSPFVLKAGTSAAFRLNDYALEGPDEHTVSAEVTQRIGRVVVGGFVRSANGIRSETGTAQPAESTALPASGFVGPPELILLNPQADRADVSVLSSGRTGQRLVSGPDLLSLAPGEVRTLSFPDFPGSGAVVQADNKQPVVATMRVTGPQGDPATVVGADPARAWLVMPGVPPSGGKALLVLQNPGRIGLHLSVQLIGANGVVETSRFSAVALPPGRTLALGIGGLTSGAPVTAVVRADQGTFVAGMASYGRQGVGYAVTLGLPMKEA